VKCYYITLKYIVTLLYDRSTINICVRTISHLILGFSCFLSDARLSFAKECFVFLHGVINATNEMYLILNVSRRLCA